MQNLSLTFLIKFNVREMRFYRTVGNLLRWKFHLLLASFVTFGFLRAWNRFYIMNYENCIFTPAILNIFAPFMMMLPKFASYKLNFTWWGNVAMKSVFWCQLNFRDWKVNNTPECISSWSSFEWYEIFLLRELSSSCTSICMCFERRIQQAGWEAWLPLKRSNINKCIWNFGKWFNEPFESFACQTHPLFRKKENCVWLTILCFFSS